MARERLFADGYELTRGAGIRDIETWDGMLGGPPVEGNNLSIPGRDGALWTPKRFGSGQFVVRMWLSGHTRQEMIDNWERLLHAVVKRDRLVRWERRMPNGKARECYGEVVGKVEPTAIGQLGMRASIEVSVPSGCWTDVADIDTGSITIGAHIGVGAAKVIDLPQFAGANAPLTQLEIHLRGGLTNPRVYGVGHPLGGVDPWFKYTGLLDSDHILIVDAKNDVVSGADLDKFTYRGPYMLEVIPPDNPATPPHVTVIHDGSDATAAIRVIGRRQFLC